MYEITLINLNSIKRSKLYKIKIILPSQSGQTHIKQGIDTYDNPSFTNDIESGQPQIRLEPNQPGLYRITICILKF